MEPAHTHLVDDEQGWEGDITMLYVKDDGFSMKLLKLRSIGVVDEYEPTTLFPHEYHPPKQRKIHSLQERNV